MLINKSLVVGESRQIESSVLRRFYVNSQLQAGRVDAYLNLKIDRDHCDIDSYFVL